MDGLPCSSFEGESVEEDLLNTVHNIANSKQESMFHENCIDNQDALVDTKPFTVDSASFEVEHINVSTDGGCIIKTEPGSANYSSNTAGDGDVQNTNAGTFQSREKCEEITIDFDEANDNHSLDNVLSSDLQLVGQSNQYLSSDDIINDENLLVLFNDDGVMSQPNTRSPKNQVRDSTLDPNEEEGSHMLKHTDKKQGKKTGRRNIPERLDSKQPNCFACWICVEKFDNCLSVKSHIMERHSNSRVLCAYSQIESKDPNVFPQLLMFCPKNCDYATAKLYAFPHHVSACDKPVVHDAGMTFLRSQGNLLSGNSDDAGCEASLTTTTTTTTTTNTPTTQTHKLLERKQGLCDKTTNKEENDTKTSEKKKENYTCQRCKLVLSSRLFLERHQKHCPRVNAPEDLTPADTESFSPLPNQQESCDEYYIADSPDSVCIEAITYQCKKCALTFQEKRDYDSHMKAVHTTTQKKEPRYKCLVCKRGFHYLGTFREHLNSHVGFDRKPHKCNICGRGFGSTTVLNVHLKRHEGIKPYKCNICNKSYERRGGLKKHQMTHTGERPYKCDECGRGFKDIHILKTHMRTHTGEKPFQCSTCGKSFAQSGTLNIHIKTHSEDRPFVCNECGVSFRQKLSYTVHMRKHKGEELFQCEQCGKCFYHKGRLRNHLMTHTGEKPFTCDVCGKKFTRATGMKIHMRIHSGERPYQCNVCWRTFYRSTHLTVHRRSHTGEQPYHCKLCDKKFMHNISLRIHTKTHHPKQNAEQSEKQV